MVFNLVAAFSFASTTAALACGGDPRPRDIGVYNIESEQLPISPGKAEVTELVIGSMLNVVVPKGAQVAVKTIAKGSMEPVVPVDESAYEQIDKSRLKIRNAMAAHPKLGGSDIRHFYVNSYGKVLIEVQSTNGQRRLIVGAVYDTPTPRGRPIDVPVAGQDEPPVFDVNQRNAGIWLKIPGKVADGWQLPQGDERGFAILRIEQLEVPYDDPAAVGIFIYGSGSMKPGAMNLVTGGFLSRKTYPFRVNVLPTVAC